MSNHQKPAVVVMALGGDGQATLDLAVHNLVTSGLPVFVAAGNEDTNACSMSPARCCPPLWSAPKAMHCKIAPRVCCAQPDHQRAACVCGDTEACSLSPAGVLLPPLVHCSPPDTAQSTLQDLLWLAPGVAANHGPCVDSGLVTLSCQLFSRDLTPQAAAESPWLLLCQQ